MAFDALIGYTRQQAPSGRVPQTGRAEGLWSAAQAGQSLGSAVAGLGRQVGGLGDQIEDEKLRQSQVNQVMAEADLDEKQRTFLAQMKNTEWVQEHVITTGDAVDQFYRDYDSATKAHAAKLHPKHRALWQAKMKGLRDRYAEPVLEKAAELREGYATTLLRSRYVNLMAAGDIEAAYATLQQAAALFGPNDALWQDELDDAQIDVVWKLAASGNIGAAKQFARELLPDDQVAAFVGDGGKLDKYNEAMQDHFEAARLAARRQIAAAADAEIRAGNALDVAPKLDIPTGDEDEDYVRQTWSQRALNAAKEARTSPWAKVDAIEAQLAALAENDQQRAAQALETAAAHRFDQRDLSPQDYEAVRSLDFDPATAKMVQGAVAAVTRYVRQWYLPGFMGAWPDIAAGTEAAIACAQRQIADGKAVNEEDLHKIAVQAAASRAELRREELRQVLGPTGLSAGRSKPSEKNKAEAQPSAADLEKQLTKGDDRTVDDIMRFPKDEEQAKLAEQLAAMRQAEGTGGNLVHKVRMEDPDGQPYWVSVKEAEEAKRHGWKESK